MNRPKSIIQRSGLIKLDKIAEMFCFEVDTFLKKWHSGEPIIRDLQLRSLGKSYVADERHVWEILERFKDNLELAVPRWRNESQRNRDNRIHR